jgi:hypothetical protein
LHGQHMATLRTLMFHTLLTKKSLLKGSLLALLSLAAFTTVSTAKVVIVWYKNGERQVDTYDNLTNSNGITYYYEPNGPVQQNPNSRCYVISFTTLPGNEPDECTPENSAPISECPNYEYFLCKVGVYKVHKITGAKSSVYTYTQSDSIDIANGMSFKVLFDDQNEVPVAFIIQDPDYSIFEGGAPKKAGQQSMPSEKALPVSIGGSLLLFGLDLQSSTPYTILDLQGKSVQRGTLTQGQSEISTASLPAGNYILTFPSSGTMRTFRFNTLK